MTTLRSILFALLFYGSTTLMVLGGIPLAFISRDQLARYAQGWGRTYLWLTRHIVGIELVIEGEPPVSPALVAVKHESAYETMAMLALLQDPVVVLKQELADIPFFGWLIRRHGVIPVNRTASAGALRSMLLAADRAKRQARTVLIFPEGTRMPHGEAGKLQAGFAGLYARLQLPVVPVALDAGLVWPRGFLKRRGVVHVRFGAAIPAGLPRKAIEDKVFTAINAFNDLDR
jgi:1-acyl-sn-glycerol-3-phosphate acyltransferase